MFSKLGFGEVALIVVAALVIFGPSKLPQLGKSIGEGLREFKKSIKSVSGELTDTVEQVKSDVAEAKKL
ncbi:MAG TPA: twin-arginine translocase TatA/TatE family subunit [Symbiobacteriaceae bacterium]|nr:twin-arginine translocase TatA/TatE family subunit [Symbiobacteriaceae bacterium]